MLTGISFNSMHTVNVVGETNAAKITKIKKSSKKTYK